jgi:hypothetical protein
MKSKFVVQVAVTVSHPDGVKLKKKAVKAAITELLMDGGSAIDMEAQYDMYVDKAVVRAVDLD